MLICHKALCFQEVLMKKILISVIAIFFFLTFNNGHTEHKKIDKKAFNIDVVVKVVSDGDTFFGMDENWKYKHFRLAGIDAPETRKRQKNSYGEEVFVAPGQPYADESKSYLEKLIANQQIECEVIGKDSFNRYLVFAWIIDGGKRYMINLLMIQKGLAEVRKIDLSSRELKIFKEAQRIARSDNLNIWSLKKHYESPEDYRQRIRKEQYNRARREYEEY